MTSSKRTDSPDDTGRRDRISTPLLDTTVRQQLHSVLPNATPVEVATLIELAEQVLIDHSHPTRTPDECKATMIAYATRCVRMRLITQTTMDSLVADIAPLTIITDLIENTALTQRHPWLQGLLLSLP